MAAKTVTSFGVKGIIPLSMLDWEGRLVTTIFLGGCNFRCPFCHNAQLVTEANTLPDIPWEMVGEILESKDGWVDGVCISGGEPTINNHLEDLLAHIKSLGLPAKLDTNGTRPEILKDLIDNSLIDAVAMDIKTSFPKYPHATQVADLSDKVRRSIDLLVAAQNREALEVEFRTTVVPTIVESEDILEIAEYLGKVGAKRYTLQQFNPKTVMKPEAGTIKPFGHEFLSELAEEASKLVPSLLRD